MRLEQQLDRLTVKFVHKFISIELYMCIIEYIRHGDFNEKDQTKKPVMSCYYILKSFALTTPAISHSERQSCPQSRRPYTVLRVKGPSKA